MLALRPRRPRGGWVSTLVLTLGMVSFSFFAVPWAYLGIWIRWAMALLFAVSLVISLRRAIDEERADESPMRMMVKILIGFFFANVFVAALRARTVPPNPIDLAFPLTRGGYVVVHGGSTPAANTYVGRGAEGYSVDVVKRSLDGELVNSPCAGTLLAASPVRMRCESERVLLEIRGAKANLPVNARLQRGQPLARATGRQLHIHATRDGAPVPMTFDGRWLVRNDVIAAK